MTEFAPRLFHSDAEIEHLGEGLLARTLPRDEWTHEAHLATTCWLIKERPEIVPERDLPDLIRRFNESVGGRNDDREGYHETITQTYVAAIRAHLSERKGDEALVDSVNALLASERGRRDWPLRFYSPGRLFSVEARREFVPPDLAALP